MSAGFNQLVDYFGAASTALVLIRSSSGETRNNIETSHTGAIDARHTGGILLNPVCVYRVVADVTLSKTLGTAWAAETVTENGITTMMKSGYMLTSMEVDTMERDFPTVTLSGTANEGANAINTWAVSVPIVARARAQNLMGAISYGGALRSVKLVASANPVVIYEDNMPCASDIVHGAVDVSGECAALAGESVPAPANNSGFFALSEPVSCESCGYKSYSFAFRRVL